MDEELNVIHLLVRVITETPESTDLELINRHTLEPVTMLRNYVEDLKSGVSLLEGHEIWENPYGRSY